MEYVHNVGKMPKYTVCAKYKVDTVITACILIININLLRQ